MEQNENINKVCIFEIKNYMYLVSNVYVFILGLICYFVFYEISNASPNAIEGMVTWGLIMKGLFGIFFFYKDKYKISFYKDKIINEIGKKELNTEDIREIYKISFFLILDDYFTVRRQHLLGKIVITILSPILLILFIFNTIFKRLYFKKNIIHTLLVIIGKNDNKIIKIQLPLDNQEEQEELENYCKEYLNTDITKLETRFFIPNNEPWFLESKVEHKY